VRRHRSGRWWLYLVGVVLLAALIAPALAAWQTRAVHADVNVTIDFSSPIARSHFSPGMTHTDNSLIYPWGNNDLAAVTNATSLMRGAVAYQNTPIMAWGLPDPWPDPSTPEPSDWTALDARLKLIISTGGIPVITLSEAPWWMKGQLQPNGTTRLLTQAEEWSTRAFSSRILDNKMYAWLHLVQRIAERYMAPPYNVRYFQVWNELKGYYDPATNRYDYTTSSGDPSGPNAEHGYTYMYNRVYDRLMAVAASLRLPAGGVYVGGPYVVMDTWSSADQSNPSNLAKAYGTFDQRPLDVVGYWLQHKAGASFIVVDAGNVNKDGINIAYASIAAEKFADLVRWIRSLDDALYPGAASLPIWLGEWYARPYTDWANNDHSNAIKTYAMMEFLKAGGAVALAWGGTDEGRAGPRLWTDTRAGGGVELPFYLSYKAFKDDFAPGTRLYKTTIFPTGHVDTLASASTIMLVNKTPNTLDVSVNGSIVTLAPYQVAILPRDGWQLRLRAGPGRAANPIRAVSLA
jgi:hypothetical protein